MKRKPIRKAVIAAAGFGTRFLPQTKAMPKEMLPLVDKPVIQYVVEELVGAGIQDIVIVTGYHKRTIEDHFDSISADLEHNLRNGGKEDLLKATKAISELANIAYVRQKGYLGTATPVLNAEHLIGDEPFIYTYADDFVCATPSRFEQLMAAYAELGGTFLTCIPIKNELDYQKYGVVGGTPVREGLMKLDKIVEKPGSSEKAPSNLASMSGYILEPAIFDYIRAQLKNHHEGHELFIQTAMQNMMNDGHPFYGLQAAGGIHYDTGDKLEYLKTVVDFALLNKDVGKEFKAFLMEKLRQN